MHRRDEQVAATWHVDHVSGTVTTAAEKAAESGNLDAKIGFLYYRIWPCPSDQLTDTHDIAGFLDQGDKDIKRARTNRDSNAVFGKRSLVGVQEKGT
jgi:hypothetical protein